MAGAELALALAAVLAAAPAPSPAARPCGLRLTADRARLEANDPRVVRVIVSSPSEPRLLASVGAVDGLRPEGAGSWTATWTAPVAGIPQIAMLTALAGDDCGLLAVPLFGSGDAEVRTRPGAEVEVRIGERLFGPGTAGRDGVALIPVEVPPGIDSVFHGARRIALDIPPVSHAFLAAWGEAAPADRERVIELLLVAVEVDGAPRKGTAPALTASAGTLGRPEPAGPGAWRVPWRLPVGPVGQAATARAQLSGEPAAELTLARPAGAPAAAELRLERAAATADEAPLEVAVLLRDAADHPADGPVEFSADAGRASAVERVEAGRYRATWTPPERLDGRTAAVLTVRAGDAEAHGRVALQPGAPARLSLTAEAAELTADGRQTLAVLAQVEDRRGNPVAAGPGVTATAGDLGDPQPDGPGRLRFAYRPRPVAAWTDEELVAALPPLSARLPLRLRPPISRFTVGAEAGAALQAGGWLGLQVGAGATAWRWLAGQELGLGLSGAFSRFRDQRTADAAGTPVPFTGALRTVTLLAVAGWRRAAGRRLAAGAEIGLGAGRVESLVGTGGPLRPEAAWRPALGAGAWVGLPAGRGRAVLALRGEWLADPHLATLQGTVAPLSLTLGYQLDVP